MPQTTTTTTTVTSTSVNQGFKVNVDTQSNTQIVGNFVTDVSIQPYIASQIISFYAFNMRPNQRIHVFFDSVLVDTYCAPGVKVSNDTSTYTSIARTGNWGDGIISDVNGHVAGQFAIPEGVFKTGDRILEITDVTNLAQGNDAMTTVASANFTASNLNVTKQIVTLTTVNPIVNIVPVTNTVVTVNTFVTSVTSPDIYNITEYHFEPIAQGLTINTPNDEAGVFATSLDLYFKQKSQVNNGIMVYLCETNNGYPDGSTMLPFSLVYKTNAEINVTTDATTKTTFTFEAPVFLANQKEYAFIVKPDGNDPDFWVWSANLGDVDITDSTKSTHIQVTSQPVIGTAFYGSTVHEWTALQTEYIKFNLNIANFSQSTGDAYFNNTDEEYLTVYNLVYTNSTVSILPGDFVFQSTNSYTNSTGSTSNTQINGVVDYYDSTRQLLYIANSSANSTVQFSGNSYIQVHRFSNSTIQTANSSTFIAGANTYVIYNPRVDAVVPQFATIAPPGTSLDFGYKGTYLNSSNSFTSDTYYSDVSIGYENELYDHERIVASKSVEAANLSSQKSMTVHASLKSDSPLLSPVIDTVKANQLAIRNMIDPIKSVYEEFFNSGYSRSKYVSRVITLADGQDAEDLQVIISGYRPPGADIQVWVKFLNAEDGDSLANKTWTPMRNLATSLFCDPSNPTDFREFVYSTPYHYPMIPTTGTVTSTSSCTAVTGTSTLFGSEISSGWYINMAANSSYNETSRRIVSISDNTHLILDQPFGTDYTAQPYYIVPPPTTAWLSQNTSSQISGNVSTYTTNNMIIGNGTSFQYYFTPGSVITVANDSQVVVSVVNSTAMTVGTPWSSNNSGVNAFVTSSAGLTYLDGSSNRYTTFKKFQIKIILQSNDASKVPILDNLRALALQL